MTTTLTESAKAAHQDCDRGSWVDKGLKGYLAGAGKHRLPTSDPFGPLRGSWLMGYLQSIKDMFDELISNPSAIQSYAQGWRGVSAALTTCRDNFASAVKEDTRRWQGKAADDYRARASEHADAIGAVAVIADAIGTVVSTMGSAVDRARDQMRQLVAELVDQLLYLNIFCCWFPFPVAQALHLVATYGDQVAAVRDRVVGSVQQVEPLIGRLHGVLNDVVVSLYDNEGNFIERPRGPGGPDPGPGTPQPPVLPGVPGGPAVPGPITPTGTDTPSPTPDVHDPELDRDPFHTESEPDPFPRHAPVPTGPGGGGLGGGFDKEGGTSSAGFDAMPGLASQLTETGNPLSAPVRGDTEQRPFGFLSRGEPTTTGPAPSAGGSGAPAGSSGGSGGSSGDRRTYGGWTGTPGSPAAPIADDSTAPRPLRPQGNVPLPPTQPDDDYRSVHRGSGGYGPHGANQRGQGTAPAVSEWSDDQLYEVVGASMRGHPVGEIPAERNRSRLFGRAWLHAELRRLRQRIHSSDAYLQWLDSAGTGQLIDQATVEGILREQGTDADPAAALAELLVRTDAAELTQEYDIAVSFAGEQREYVERAVAAAKSLGLRVFYDRDLENSWWGRNFVVEQRKVYGQLALHFVPFISTEYLAKGYSRDEFAYAMVRAIESGNRYILPVLFGQVVVPPELLNPHIGYLRAEEHPPERLAALMKVTVDESRAAGRQPRDFGAVVHDAHTHDGGSAVLGETPA